MKYELHPDPTMGLVWIKTDSPLTDGELLHAFPLTEDEQSQAYVAWRTTQESEQPLA